jgi:hypothetical protein
LHRNMTGPGQPITNQSPGAEQALAAQFQQVIEAFQISGADPARELRSLDEVFEKAGESAAAFVGVTAQTFFQQPGIFDNLNFQSSLLDGGSVFFAAVLRQMGALIEEDITLAEDAKLPLLIRMVEHYRRAKKGEEMESFAARVESEMSERINHGDSLALGQLAKVRYEQSMHQYDCGRFADAIRTGEESINLCRRAGDLFGILAARGNTAGLFRYEWANSLASNDPRRLELFTERIHTLRRDLAIAQSRIRGSTEDSPEWIKFARVEMNNAAHLMKIAEGLQDVDLARQMTQILRANSLFFTAASRREQWTMPYAQILLTLEESE